MSKSKRTGASVSRRAFLKKGATAGVGATALASVGTRNVEAQNFWDLSADVVTLGAGTAGLAAAVSGLDHGASVIMVDENVEERQREQARAEVIISAEQQHFDGWFVALRAVPTIKARATQNTLTLSQFPVNVSVYLPKPRSDWIWFNFSRR